MKYVILTGASGGIGHRLTKDLLREDLDRVVVAIYNRNKPVHNGFGDVHGDRLITQQLDVADAGAVLAWARDLKFAPWAVINMHGVTMNAMHWKATGADEANLLETNLLGTMNMCAALAPLMREAGGGRVINVSSVVARAGAIGCSAYAASKGGVEAYTRAIALELARKRVTANSVALGYMELGMTETMPDSVLADTLERVPLNRLGTISEVAALVEYLLGDHSAYMTGQTLQLNGGLSLG